MDNHEIATFEEVLKKEKDIAFVNVLIVDDDPFILTALEKTLSVEECRILKAQQGKTAIEILKKIPLAVIICDYHMPDVSGLEVLKESLRLQPDCVRIVLTGVSDLKVIEQLINIGQISQFVVKPWDHAALVQTMHASIEKYQLIVENRRLHVLAQKQHEKLEENHHNLQKELLIGGQIQEVLLIGKAPENIPGIVIEAHTIPSKEIDGDFLDFYRPNSEILDVVIGDVMGKGLPAALVGTAVKMQIARFAIPFTPIKSYNKKNGWLNEVLAPCDILQRVQQEIAVPLIELEYFATLIYGRFHFARQTFSFIDCGATKPLHYSASHKRALPLSGVNTPLGITQEDVYQEFEVSFQDKDLFVFYSDGMTEGRAPDGQLFGIERLTKLIEENAEKSPKELYLKLKESIMAFTQKKTFDDDLTLMIIQIADIEKLPSQKEGITGKFSADILQLKNVRDFVTRLCLKIPGDVSRFTSQLQLAINEVFCNIVKHGYKENSLGQVEIKGELTENGLWLDIADSGISFDPSKIQDPSLAGDRDSGFGLFMVKQLVDQISYSCKEAHGKMNHLRLFKRFLDVEDFMEITLKKEDHVLVISPEGDNLDAKETAAFKQRVTELVSNAKIYQVVLDLQHLHFIDSSGLGAILSLLRFLNSQGGDLKVVGMKKPVRAVFELVCMHKIFEIYNTTEDALKAFKSH